MAKKNYMVAAPEAAVRYGAEEGTVIELTLDEGDEVALVAAGWLTPEKKTKEATK